MGLDSKFGKNRNVVYRDCASCGSQNKAALPKCVECRKRICEACQSWCDNCDQTRCLACATTATSACACAAKRYWEYAQNLEKDAPDMFGVLTPNEFLKNENELGADGDEAIACPDCVKQQTVCSSNCDTHYVCSNCGEQHGEDVLQCPTYSYCIYVHDTHATCDCNECMCAALARENMNG